MANLIINRSCQLQCSHCFASSVLNTHSSPYVSADVFEEWLNFLERSDIQEIRLIGGEPTLHPQFIALLKQALRRQKRILIFSHGWLNERVLRFLESLPETAVSVMVNINAHPSNLPDHVQKQTYRKRVLQRLGGRAILGYTICNPDFDLGPIFALIDELGLERVLRLGLAQPVWNGKNKYLHPKQYPLVGQKIALFWPLACSANIKLEFDCGFVPCMFSEDERALLRDAQPDLEWHCSPVLDVDIDNHVYHCFPLSAKVFSILGKEECATEIRARMIQQTNLYRPAGIYPKCSRCPIRDREQCPGGCLAATLKRYRQAEVEFTLHGYLPPKGGHHEQEKSESTTARQLQ